MDRVKAIKGYCGAARDDEEPLLVYNEPTDVSGDIRK